MQSQKTLDYIRTHYRREGGALIGKRFGMSKSLVQRYASRMGLVVDDDAKRAHKRAKFDAMKPADYKVSPLGFSRVTTPEAAYLLGLLWADGHICAHSDPRKLNRRVFLSMLADDMRALRPTIEATGKWNWRQVQHKSRQLQTRVETSNKPLYDLLERLDYHSKSASPDRVLATIPKHLKHYWFRGLFDGDGNLSIVKSRRLSVASCFDQDWSYLERLCLELRISSCRIVRTTLPESQSSCFEIGCVPDMLRFCEYIYQGRERDRIGLPRKWKTYRKLCDAEIGTSHKPTAYRLKEVLYDRKAGSSEIVRLLAA